MNSVGYCSIFLPIVHTDWNPENQLGTFILLHTTSLDKVEILGDFIDCTRSQGYEFGS